MRSGEYLPRRVPTHDLGREYGMEGHHDVSFDVYPAPYAWASQEQQQQTGALLGGAGLEAPRQSRVFTDMSLPLDVAIEEIIADQE